MKIIAFKRAGKDFPALHPEFITEYVDAALIPSTEGYETMVEEHFNLELAKNADRHEAHLKHLKSLEEAERQAQSASEVLQAAEEKQLNREFEQFKRWKASKK